jgi:hypothetical protein
VADENTQQPTTPGTQTPAAPSSSPSSSPAPSGQSTAAPAAGDQSTQTTQTAKAERPAYVPENFWDASTGKVKDTEFGEHFNELTAFRAAEQSKQLARPQKLEDYKLVLPKDFKAPEGMNAPAFDDQNPLTAKFRETALKHGLTQDAASDLLAIYAAGQIEDQATQKKAFDGEVAKLGVTGPQRVDAVKTWLKATGSEVLAGTLWTADIVKSFEALMSKFTGGGNFSQQHREPPPANGAIPGIENMNFRQARAAQDAAAKGH